MKKIILASASPRRRELLKQAGVAFEVIVSRTEENITRTEPEEIVKELAEKKACAVAENFCGQALVIGADTIVALDGRILGKPKSEEEAFEMLKSLQGRTHQVYTGVALADKSQGELHVKSFYECTDVTMYSMSNQEIQNYIDTGEPMDKAGAYGIQGRAAVFVKEIRGDYNNVVGLPISRIYQEIKKWLKD